MTRARVVMLVSSSLLVASFIVPLGSAAGGACHPGATGEVTQGRAAEAAASVAAGECRFEPTVAYVDPGTDITWINKDPAPHSVTGANQSWGTEKLLEQNDSITYAFDEEGVFPYYCVLHPGMVGAVVVGDPAPSTVAPSLSTGANDGAGSIPAVSGAAAKSARQEASSLDELSAPVITGLSAVGLVLGTSALLLIGRRRREAP